MLSGLLSRLEPVHEACTREEREAIYRFRYQVYVEELHHTVGGVDHEKRWLHDEDDDAPYAIHVYTGTLQEVTGAVRMMHWEPGKVPEREFRMLSMERVPDILERRVAELGRFMIHHTLRGRLLLPALARYGYECLVGEHGVEMMFLCCAPGLISAYARLGFRTFGGALVSHADGMHVPMMGIPSDHERLARIGSPAASVARKYYGPGRRPPLDPQRYEHLFEDASVVMDPEHIWEEMQHTLQDADAGPSFLHQLPERLVNELGRCGCIVEVAPGTLVTQEGYVERELYVILSGSFEVLSGGRRLAVVGAGEVLGEVAFFRESGCRSASVRAVAPGRVLMLRRKVLESMMKDEPAMAAELLFHLARVVSERLAAANRRMRLMVARPSMLPTQPPDPAAPEP
jgi:CRP-like cAMP-binding protein